MEDRSGNFGREQRYWLVGCESQGSEFPRFESWPTLGNGSRRWSGVCIAYIRDISDNVKAVYKTYGVVLMLVDAQKGIGCGQRDRLDEVGRKSISGPRGERGGAGGRQ